MAPSWSVVLVLLIYAAQLGPDLLDGLLHLEHRATRHVAGAHFESPDQLSSTLGS